jgi:hypothetical protein
VDGRYFVSGEFYKTLLLMRAGAIGTHHGGPPALPAPRHNSGATALREHPRQPMLAIEDKPSMPAITSSSLTHRISDHAHNARAEKAIDLRECTAELLARLRLDIQVDYLEWLLADEDERPIKAGVALEELMKGRTVLGSRARELERSRRQQLDAEAMRLGKELAGADAIRQRTVDEAANQIFRLLPVLLLLPDAGFEQALHQCLEELDAAGAADNGHRDSDHRMQTLLRELATNLSEQDRRTYSSWSHVGDLLANYEEPRPTLTVVGKNA